MDKTEGREVRVAVESWPDADMELRVEESGNGLTFRGYAAVFNELSEDLGGFRERILPGAFAKTLREKRAIKMFLNHNSDIVLASTHRGTLRLTEDERGLLSEADLPDNEWGRPVADAVRRGDINSMSFGFQSIRNGTPKDEDAVVEQREIRLWEVSPVTAWPAYPQTSASVRELAEAIEAEVDELAEAFRVLREADATLTPEQHDLLLRAINSKYELPVVPPRLAERQSKWADLLTL